MAGNEETPLALLDKPNTQDIGNNGREESEGTQTGCWARLRAVYMKKTNEDTSPSKITLDFCDKNTKKHQTSETYLFNYSEENIKLLHWKELRKLKVAEQWDVIKHPYVLNYVNQVLNGSALFYTLHISAFFFFLFLLSSHIFERTLVHDILLTSLIAIFGIFLLLKTTIKTRISRSFSFWFVVALTFNVCSYFATLAYVWLPTLFSYDDYYHESKKDIKWFLPIIAIISAWANCLYVLRKTPLGIYILMMTKILKSFGAIATIWIITLIAFSFCFHLIMRDTGIKPWSNLDQQIINMTMLHKTFVIFQAITKTSTMMIGEIDANDILETNQWIPSVLVLAFEITSVILLMNLMISLAVGEVADLRRTALDRILKIKVNFVIEVLQFDEEFRSYSHCLHYGKNKKEVKNVLVINSDSSYCNFWNSLGDRDATQPDPNEVTIPANYVEQEAFVELNMEMRISTAQGRQIKALFENYKVVCKESPASGIKVVETISYQVLPKTSGF